MNVKPIILQSVFAASCLRSQSFCWCNILKIFPSSGLFDVFNGAPGSYFIIFIRFQLQQWAWEPTWDTTILYKWITFQIQYSLSHMRNGLNQNIEIFLFHIKVSDFQSSWLKLETKSIFQTYSYLQRCQRNSYKHM